MNPFRVIVADPPWKFGDKLPAIRGAESHYPCMKTEDLCKLDLPPIADNALLFLWKVAALTEDALNVMHMWGFTMKTEIVWVKTKKGLEFDEAESVDDLSFGMGRYTRAAHETCLVGARGKALELVKNHSIRSVFFAPRQDHSRKPDIFYDLVEGITGGEGPYLELFARRRRAGWVGMGDELGTHLGMKRWSDIRQRQPPTGTYDA